MKIRFKILIFMFSSAFFIAGCGGGSSPNNTSNKQNNLNADINMRFPAPGSHYAYVSGHADPVITSYAINAYGDFINPKTTVLGVADSINGVTVAPDHKYIFFSHGSNIGKCALNNDGSVSSDCNYDSYSLPNGIANFLAVNKRYDRLYITDQVNLNVYVCEINPYNNDSLGNCKYALQLPYGTYDREQGIEVSADHNTVYIAYQNIYSKYTIKSCKTRILDGVIVSDKCRDYNSFTFNEYIGGIAINPMYDVLYAADMQQSKVFITCSIDSPFEDVDECIDLQDQKQNIHYRTFDVASDYLGLYLYITTSQSSVRKVYEQNGGANVISMPATQGRPSYSIATF